MSRLSGALNGVRVFLEEVGTELKKSAWPTWPELSESTVVILVSVILLGIFAGLCDVILAGLIRLLVRG